MVGSPVGGECKTVLSPFMTLHGQVLEPIEVNFRPEDNLLNMHIP